MGKYSARGWQYWPDRREGQYRTRELNIYPYCLTLGSAIIDLLYDFILEPRNINVIGREYN